MADNFVERELRLKDAFKQSPTYNRGVVWSNKRLTKAEAYLQTNLVGEEAYNLPPLIEVTLPSGIGQEIQVFGGSDGVSDDVVRNQTTRELKIGRDIPLNVVRAAINRNKKLTFSSLEAAFPYLASTESFMTGKRLLSGIKIEVTGSSEALKNLNQEQKLYIAAEVLRHVEERIELGREEYRGSETFEAIPIRKAFADHIRRKYVLHENSDAETGRPQLESPRYGLNIQNLAWYGYSENYGTSEEKSLVKTLNGIINDLREHWSNIYLLRNEKAVTLYDLLETTVHS
jgi:type III restriction enzyme